MKMHWPAIANMLYPCICHSEFRNSERKELKLSVTHLSLENNLPTFRLNVPIVIMAKVKEVRANVAIYSHALLRIHIIGGQRSVRIAPPSLPPTQRSSSQGLLVLHPGCRASFTNNSCPLPWSSIVFSSQSVGWWFSRYS